MTNRTHLSFALMAAGIYMVAPTPDELLVHPLMGYVISRAFDVSFQTGVVWSCTVYIVIGLIFLATSLLLGGRVILCELDTRVHEGAALIARSLDEKPSQVFGAVDHGFNNTVEAQQVLMPHNFDY